MIFLKLKDNSKDYQHQSGEEIELIPIFIKSFYYEREFVQDSIDRFVIVVKYGEDTIRLRKDGDEFIKWFIRHKK